MKLKTLQWYRLRGYSLQTDGQTVDCVFVFIVESQSKHNVIKYHGGRRKCPTPDGKQAIVYFPRHEHEIERMPREYHVTPESLSGPQYVSKNLVIRVIPATRYLCSCGQEHISEYPYPAMWCSCGNKAFPTPYMAPQEPTPAPFSPALLDADPAQSLPLHRP